MPNQLGYAYSSNFMGVGVFAGDPCMCAGHNGCAGQRQLYPVRPDTLHRRKCGMLGLGGIRFEQPVEWIAEGRTRNWKCLAC